MHSVWEVNTELYKLVVWANVNDVYICGLAGKAFPQCNGCVCSWHCWQGITQCNGCVHLWVDRGVYICGLTGVSQCNWCVHLWLGRQAISQCNWYVNLWLSRHGISQSNWRVHLRLGRQRVSQCSWYVHLWHSSQSISQCNWCVHLWISRQGFHNVFGVYIYGLAGKTFHSVFGVYICGLAGKIRDKALQLQAIATVQLVINHGDTGAQNGTVSQVDRENNIKIQVSSTNAMLTWWNTLNGFSEFKM